MKLNFSAVLRTLLFAATANASVAHVYLSNPETYPHNLDTTVSPSTARLVLAQRLDVAQYHSLGNADAATIAAVNDFGGRPKKLFGEDEDRDRIRFLFVIEGSEKATDVAPGSGGRLFAYKIDNPPDSKANVQLLSDLHSQSFACADDESQVADDEIYEFWKKTPLMASANAETLTTARTRGIAHSISLEQIANKYGSSSSEYRAATATLRETIDQLFTKAAEDDWDVTVVVMPLKASSGIFKRSTPSSWGKYAVPKRQLEEEPDSSLDTELGSGTPPNNVADTESTLDATIDRPSINKSPTTPEDTSKAPVAGESDKESHSFLNDIGDFIEEAWDDLTASASSPSTFTAAEENYTTPVKGILPSCFSSMSDCITSTHRCSGHGSCFLKFTDESSGACYACGCNATRVVLDDGGVQVTYWAGPACQKVDLSTEFWLIGGTVLALLGAAVWGVGLLYSMGSQELPSVLGAGVAGPRAK